MCLSKNKLYFTSFYFILIIIFYCKTEFDINDGFYSQLIYIINEGVSIDLTFIHFLRLFVFYPIYIFKIDSNIFYLLIGLLIYHIPIYKYLINEKKFYVKILILFTFLVLAYGLSERVYLSIIGGFCLYLYFTKSKYKIYLLYGIIFSILSSGNILILTIYIIVFSNYIFYNKRILKYILLIFLFFLLSFSIIHKFDYFLNEVNGLFSIFTRSTIYVSLFYEQYPRFIFTLILLSFLLIIPTIFLSYIKNINDKRIIMFFYIGLISFIFEGITFFSYIIPIIHLIITKIGLHNNVKKNIN
ncbi:hypothetical protein CRU88_09485 [Arcobacter sp. CECT 9188]|nr:hypothetical protein CRU88_09485 [Arcobacter sp. CECT 9188]